MEYTRMRTKDMLQYCDEALAWEEFGPVDIFFFESVKRILLGQCPVEDTEQEPDELAEVPSPIPAEELLEYDENCQKLGECITEETFFENSDSYQMTEESSRKE